MVGPARVAVVGIGGYGRSHHHAFLQLEEEGLVKVVATCDPRMDEPDVISSDLGFMRRGVKIYPAFEKMLSQHAGALDLVTIAAPIHLHGAMHKACLDASLPCYLEKPPTLDPVEFACMMTNEAKARYLTQVGFHFIYLSDRLDLKRRIVAGEFGCLKRVSFTGLVRRSLGYYARNQWAGRLMLGNAMILDSCFGNAFAHNLNNLLFYAGTHGLDQWAQPLEVRATLLRANNIQGADTVFAVAKLEGGCELRMAATHATATRNDVLERLEFEKAVVEIRPAGNVVIKHADGSQEVRLAEKLSLPMSFTRYLEYLAGAHAQPSMTLENSRAFVDLNALIYLAAGKINPVSEAALHVEGINLSEQAMIIPGIEEAVVQFVTNPEGFSHRWESYLPSSKPSFPAGIAGLRDLTLTQMAA